jgi:hypothetical protein
MRQTGPVVSELFPKSAIPSDAQIVVLTQTLKPDVFRSAYGTGKPCPFRDDLFRSLF